jgi:hypothetical protein
MKLQGMLIDEMMEYFLVKAIRLKIKRKVYTATRPYDQHQISFQPTPSVLVSVNPLQLMKD